MEFQIPFLGKIRKLQIVVCWISHGQAWTNLFNLCGRVFSVYAIQQKKKKKKKYRPLSDAVTCDFRS